MGNMAMRCFHTNTHIPRTAPVQTRVSTTHVPASSCAHAHQAQPNTPLHTSPCTPRPTTSPPATPPTQRSQCQAHTLHIPQALAPTFMASQTRLQSLTVLHPHAHTHSPPLPHTRVSLLFHKSPRRAPGAQERCTVGVTQPTEHPDTALPRDENSPLHFSPSPSQPVRHLHLKLPGTLMQDACMSQL